MTTDRLELSQWKSGFGVNFFHRRGGSKINEFWKELRFYSQN